MADPWLRRDYTGWWRLPDPLPPARWPRVLLGLIAGLFVIAIAVGLPTTPGDGGREVGRQTPFTDPP